MKRIILILIALPLLCQGQGNLVPNGDFEELWACPNDISQIDFAIPWTGTTVGSPDLYNLCSPPLFFPPDLYIPNLGVAENGAGYQYAHSGDGYAGIFAYGGQDQPNGREYLQVPLTESIQGNVDYIVSFWASLADKFQYAVGSLGMYFSDTLVTREQFNSVLEVEPSVQSPDGVIMSDKDIWYHVTDTFRSRYGGEQYLLIGNFKSTAESDTLLVPTGADNRFQSYYYIDDVSVVALGDTVSGIAETERLSFSVYPNPSNGRMMIGYILGEGETGKLTVYNTVGELIFERPLNGTESLMEIDLANISSGIYFLNINVNDERRLTERLSILRE